MTQAPAPRAPSTAAPVAAAVSVRGVTWTAYAMAFAVGWSMVLIPALVRNVEATFGQDDASMGIAYLVFNGAWIVGAMATGVLARRVPRALLMAGGPGLIAAGLVGMAVAPVWGAFLAGYLAFGFGLGISDSGINAIIMDAHPARSAGHLNRLHLWLAIAALIGPLTVGQLVAAGFPWQAVLGASAIGTAAVALLVVTRRLPAYGAGLERRADGPGNTGPRAGRIPLPVILLSVAIGCYVATEVGISAWIVRFLDEAPIQLATLALGLFWGGMAAGRALTSFVHSRSGPARLAWAASLALGVLVIGAVLAPSLGLAIVLFTLAGVAAGPVYPLLMAIGGGRYPDRSSMVSSTLASAGVVGSLLYPPLMGLMSGSLGLAAGMLGAALFSFVAAVFTRLGATLPDPDDRVTPARADASQG